MFIENVNLIFEISNIDNNFRIGIFEEFENKENLLKLYESLIISTEKIFDQILNGNYSLDIDSKYYIDSNKKLISNKLNKDDITFVEQTQELISKNNFEKEYLQINVTHKTSKPKEVVRQPNQLDILLGFGKPITQTKSSTNNKPGRGQKNCKFCFEVIGVRCLICKFCNKSLT